MKGKKAVLNKQEHNKEPGWEEWVSSIQTAGRRHDDPVNQQGQGATSMREAISKLAYSYWEARGFQGGSAEEDWLRAEAQIKQQVLRSRKTGDAEIAEAALV